MAKTKPSKGADKGQDRRDSPGPKPGGNIDTGESLIPPYEGRSQGRNERAEGVKRMLSGKAAPKAASQPESAARPRAGAGMAPEGVGESSSRHGEDVIKQEGKEPGRHNKGTKGKTDRPVGGSTDRDTTGI